MERSTPYSQVKSRTFWLKDTVIIKNARQRIINDITAANRYDGVLIDLNIFSKLNLSYTCTYMSLMCCIRL